MKLLLSTFMFVLVVTISYAQDKFHLDEVYKLSPNGTITLEASDAKIFITGTERKDVHVKIDRRVSTSGMSFGDRTFDVEVSESNGNLEIYERQSGSISIIGYMSEVYEIRIEAPATASLILDGDDDDYEIRNINGSITADVDDGDMVLTECNGSSFDFDFDDGDLVMNSGSGSLKINADDTDIIIKGAAFNYIDIDVDDCDIDVETSLKDSGSYNFYGDDTRFSLSITNGGGEFNIRHDDGSVNASSAYQVLEDEENRKHLILKGGNAKINFRVDDGSVRLSTL